MKDKSLTLLTDAQGKKLTKPEREQVIDWISEFNTPTEVTKLVSEFFGKNVTRQSIGGYQTRYAKTIEKKQKKFLDELDKIPEANKTLRVKRLSDVAKMLRGKMDLPGRGWLQIVSEYRATLKQIAEEIEGTKGAVGIEISDKDRTIRVIVDVPRPKR